MKLLQVVFAALFFTLTAHAQYITIDDTLTPQQLVEMLVGGDCSQVSNVSVSGWSNASGRTSYAAFNGAGTSVPFERGILLTTGIANSAEGPNMLLLSEGIGTWDGDSDLEAALQLGESFNATVLEFDFVPLSNTIKFNYIFASEEYIANLQPNACHYTDGFAFLLKETGSAGPYQNLAVLPGTDIPVMITTVRGLGNCPPANPEYFGGYNQQEHPTNYNGQTVVLTAQSGVTPGVTYHIKLVIADQGDTLYDSAIFLEAESFSTVADLGDDRLISNRNPLCNGEVLAVNAATLGATGYQWYMDDVAIAGAVNPMYTITAAGTYTVDIQFGACTAVGKIKVEYAAPLPVTGTLVQCDENADGLTIYSFENIKDAVMANTTGIQVTGYYLTEEAANAGTPQINTGSGIFTNTIVNQQLYVGVKNGYGCTGITRVTLSTPATALSVLAPLESCDVDGVDDGLFTFDLNDTRTAILATVPTGLEVDFYKSYQDALVISDALTETQFTNTIPGGQILYARVSNGVDCFGITELPLVVHYFGTLQDESVFLCDGSSLVVLAPMGMDAYEWQTQQGQTLQNITITQPGDYKVLLTNAQGCTGVKTYHALLSGAPRGAGYDINDFAGNHNSLLVSPKGNGQYEFSLDGIRYQPQGLFENLAAGEYLVRIRDANGCGPEFRDKVTILDYMKFFTPNNDGVNDLWEILNLKSRPGLLVRIYDRFGKPIISFKGETGWDGTLNGKPLPATDYWFAITLENGRTIKGHFSLVR